MIDGTNIEARKATRACYRRRLGKSQPRKYNRLGLEQQDMAELALDTEALPLSRLKRLRVAVNVACHPAWPSRTSPSFDSTFCSIAWESDTHNRRASA